MRERIDAKIDEIIESILAKDPRDISYSEYKILDCRSKDLRYAEEQKQRTEEMTQLMCKTFGYGFAPVSALPEPEIKEE